MALATKIPGVYVEEISKFPPSIAEVETAIPAFIGHTEKAKQYTPDDLRMIPKKISSMLDFEVFFGGANKPVVNSVTINPETREVTDASITYKNYLYDSLQLFYTNGGGVCYIVSIGSFNDDFDKGKFLDGLTKIKEEDEPTILLFPDAVNLSQADFKDVQQAALMQCGELMDRVTILDIKEGDELGERFRDDIGMTYLKYGAAYTPWLKANLTESLDFSDVFDKLRDSEGKKVLFTDFVSADEAAGLSKRLEDIAFDNQALTTLSDTIAALNKAYSDQRKAYLAAVNTHKTAANPGTTDVNIVKAFRNLLGTVYKAASALEGAAETIKDSTLQTSLITRITNSLVGKYTELIQWEFALAKTAAFENAAELNDYESLFGVDATYAPNTVPKAEYWGKDNESIFKTADSNTVIVADATYEELLTPTVTTNLKDIDAALGKLGAEIVAEGLNSAKTINEALEAKSNAYKILLKSIESQSGVIPPSGAIAGLYCLTDNTRGVWKAPANISIGGINGVSRRFRNDELENLNIDVNAGKSINAIRPITGQGTMVMGARTLAGNDKEWRYVPVRRFYNFVEESTKKSTQWAVFEPNDANLWLKVKTMVENFLYNLWRQGALAGAKPEHAYYVACGLGQTMTSQDILDGKLNIEIGMAVVRPAEFIVLRFFHKLQES
ncbi:phage tail sheath family protein [Larkinella rosea]|uniref:Phage tail protein n=1 Tax=Larkinella rosea TaxID=2025312 RepID=A0A3P1C2Z4_9BACT|nr:phage tail sheath C-terminal domain-containing protein [Larkinella rosea]RRB07755.1 phage tail protein [Larkinella rosea]